MFYYTFNFSVLEIMKKRGRPKIYKTEVDNNIRKIQLSKLDLKKISFCIFKEWYLKQNDLCIYCGLSSKDSLILFKKYPDSTRNGKRGKSLELDRKNPLITDYSILENLCLACY